MAALDLVKALVGGSRIATLPSYLGQVATKCSIPGHATASAHYMMSRTVHTARDDISSLVACWPNFHCQGALGEQSFAGPLTLRVALEYPLGARPIPITFGGNARGLIAPLSILRNDPLPVRIRRGTRFAFRTLQANPAGVLYSSSRNQGRPGKLEGEGSVTGSQPLADDTRTNTLPGPSTAAYGPCAVIGQTTRPSFFLAGDSRFVGSGEGAVAQDSTGAKGDGERSIAEHFAFINAATGGDRLQSCIGNYALRLSLSRFCSHGIHNYGINDVMTGRTAAAVLADDVTFAAMFAIPMWATTLSPRTASTDGWTSLEGQSIPTVGQEAHRRDVNRGRRAVPAGLMGCLDTADAVENTRDGGLWRPGFVDDGLHGNERATLAIKRSRVIDGRALVAR